MALKPKVLIADDDPRNIFALKAVLGTKGYAIVTATNGLECIEILKTNPDVAIILMDMMMPEMDGYETIRELRNYPQYKDLPIIAVTAQAMVGDKDKCMEAGASDYVSKPIDIELLEKVMQFYISN